MNNVEVKIENGRLIVSLPLNSQPAPSKSGKTKVVASTHGNVATACTVQGQPVIVGVNAYIRG